MKKIYMPSNEILYKMQSLGGDIYKYLLVKAYESLIVESINNHDKGILKTTYKYLKEYQDIINAICLSYPEEIKYSEVASYDVSLAQQLLKKLPSMEIYNLDNLAYFDKSVGNDVSIIKTTIDILDEYLPTNSKYRFEYKSIDGYCTLLDDIFSTRIIDKNIYWNNSLKEKASRIEPAYAVMIPMIGYKDDFLEQCSRKDYLRTGIYAYASRYGLANVESRKVDLNNPDEDTKKLIRCIKCNHNNLY